MFVFPQPQTLPILAARNRRVALFSSESRPSGAGFFQRVSSFLSGAGLMALGTQYYLYQELRDGNKLMLLKHQELELRIKKLEK